MKSKRTLLALLLLATVLMTGCSFKAKPVSIDTVPQGPIVTSGISEGSVQGGILE